jgi:hypothetical protein
MSYGFALHTLGKVRREAIRPALGKVAHTYRNIETMSMVNVSLLRTPNSEMTFFGELTASDQRSNWHYAENSTSSTARSVTHSL